MKIDIHKLPKEQQLYVIKAIRNSEMMVTLLQDIGPWYLHKIGKAIITYTQSQTACEHFDDVKELKDMHEAYVVFSNLVETVEEFHKPENEEL
jgi:hypothetical protein